MDELRRAADDLLRRTRSRRVRRAIAAFAAAAAVLLCLPVLTTGGGPTVLVAARDLPAGTVLAADDVRPGTWTGDAPSLLTSPEQAVGRRLVVDVGEGAPLGQGALLDGGAAAGRGLVLASVRIDEPTALALARPGARIDVLAASTRGDAPARVVAAGVGVVAVPRTTSSGPFGVGAGADDATAGAVVLAVDRATASALAAAAAVDRMTLVALPG